MHRALPSRPCIARSLSERMARPCRPPSRGGWIADRCRFRTWCSFQPPGFDLKLAGMIPSLSLMVENGADSFHAVVEPRRVDQICLHVLGEIVHGDVMREGDLVAVAERGADQLNSAAACQLGIDDGLEAPAAVVDGDDKIREADFALLGHGVLPCSMEAM